MFLSFNYYFFINLYQEICHESVFDPIKTLEQKGIEQYNEFVSERLERGTKSVHDPITKNNYPLMSTHEESRSTYW